MAETNPTAAKSTTTPVASTGRGLAPASESGDPEVHRLLAERQAHVSNAGMEPDPELEAVRKAAKESIDEIDKKLADLGYTAK
jgi:hypothetical protein